jgi:hypothetical protein
LINFKIAASEGIRRGELTSFGDMLELFWLLVKLFWKDVFNLFIDLQQSLRPFKEFYLADLEVKKPLLRHQRYPWLRQYIFKNDLLLWLFRSR